MAAWLLSLYRARDASQRTGRRFSCGVDNCTVRCAEARQATAVAHTVAYRDRALSRRDIAMVHLGAASQSRIPPLFLPAAEPGALHHRRPLPPSSALLVLPANRAAGASAVDSICHRRRG